MNKKKFFDTRNFKLAMVQDDPLGEAFGVNAFHRCQVENLLRGQLTPVAECSVPTLVTSGDDKRDPNITVYAADDTSDKLQGLLSESQKMGGTPGFVRKRTAFESDSEDTRCSKIARTHQSEFGYRQKRCIFVPEYEQLYHGSPEFSNYLKVKLMFNRNIGRLGDFKCPIKRIKNPSNALETIEYVNNPKLVENFENQRQEFRNEGKVDENGNVKECFLFHGAANISMNNIIENNCSVPKNPKALLFGTGVSFSELPEVSLMHGDCLILCKVGSVDFYLFRIGFKKKI